MGNANGNGQGNGDKDKISNESNGDVSAKGNGPSFDIKLPDMSNTTAATSKPPGVQMSGVLEGSSQPGDKAGTGSAIPAPPTEAPDQSNRKVTPASASEEISKDGHCGVNFNNKRCPGKQCCSQFGWCGGEQGKASDWCSVNVVNHVGASDGKYDGRQ